MAGFVPFKRIRTGDNSWSHVRSRSDDDLAGRALRKHLIEQVVSGVMSAEQCGILCCKITAAGGVGCRGAWTSGVGSLRRLRP